MNSPERARSVAPHTENQGPLHPNWLRASLLCGFIATFAMTVTLAVGYAIANSAGEESGNTM